jgi:hypothetical protein
VDSVAVPSLLSEDAMSQHVSASFEDKTTELLKTALVGLGSLPTFEESVLQSIVTAGALPDDHSKDKEKEKAAADVRVTKALFAVTEHLKKEVVLPMYELNRRLTYRVEAVRATHKAQVDVLEGNKPSTTSSIIYGMVITSIWLCRVEWEDRSCWPGG